MFFFFGGGEAGSCDSPATSSVVGQKYPASCIHLRLRAFDFSQKTEGKVFGSTDPRSDLRAGFSVSACRLLEKVHISTGKKKRFNQLVFSPSFLLFF